MIILLPALILVSAGCGQKDFHIYSDPAYAQRVEKKFAERKALAVNRNDALFDVFNQKLTEPEQEGLKFLFAYMPLSDLADYPGEYYLKQVRWSLAARDTFSWGHAIPEDVFRHFVLPYRVNNENLDTARIVFFHELKDRIRNMSMLDAALEVNHWCHEKVTYHGSDIRTSSSLATVKTAWGRCGEESTFTVTALRSVAIPARQVYTPRWAHSDDNHAWVEFWADGKWHYMGACEPDCVPDLGWFTEPTRRAMLIHTKAFGYYKGTERAENREPDYALLNTLPTYAATKVIFVKVLDENKAAVKDATVEFQLYNYAEYYPIATIQTDSAGLCSFLTGFGDLLVWAHNDNLFGFKKITVADIDTLTLTLDQRPYGDLFVEYDMVPPIQREPMKTDVDCREQNNIRLRKEDSIRGAYENTFPKEADARSFAASLDLDPDQTWAFISGSRGNYAEIENFLKGVAPDMRPTAMELLKEISAKDLRDTKANILMDHLVPAKLPENGPLIETLLNPRVSNEMLTAYRQQLINRFGESFISGVRKDPERLVSWIRDNIRINSVDNYYNAPLSPVGVYDLKIADAWSRKIFTVSCYRTFGIPSRLMPGTLQVQYWNSGHWNTVNFDNTSEQDVPTGTVVLASDPANPVKPQYEIHYTLARYDKGRYNTLAFGGEYDMGDPLSGPVTLPEGYYVLVTGNRMTDGSVLSSLTYFRLNGGETRHLVITLRKSGKSPGIMGTIHPDWPVKTLDGKPFDWKEVLASGNAIICWVEPDREPSKHIFQDLGVLKSEIDQLKCPFVFLVPQNMLPAGFSPADWKGLPATTRFATIPDLASLKELEKATDKTLEGDLPVVIRMDGKGNVTYLSSGYKIGIGEEIVKEVSRGQ